MPATAGKGQSGTGLTLLEAMAAVTFTIDAQEDWRPLAPTER